MRAEYSKSHDPQLIAFLSTLINRHDDVIPILSRIGKVEMYFIVFNMYLQYEGIIQKYKLAVDDYLPLTQEGVNLFCQAESGDNALLPFLEKAWAKYVYITNMKDKVINKECIDRIMLAFLGSPSLKIKTSYSNFEEEFMANYFEGAYVFCYLKPETKYSKDKNLLKPFFLRSCEIVAEKKIYFLQADDSNGGLDNSDEGNSENKVESFPKYSDYTDEKAKEKGLFFLTPKDFMAIFETVYICTYKQGEICRHHSVSLKQGVTEGGRFEVTNAKFRNCFSRLNVPSLIRSRSP